MNIPTNWIHGYCNGNEHHHNDGIFFEPDWSLTEQVYPVLAVALKKLLTMNSPPNYINRSLYYFTTKAKEILQNSQYSSMQKKIALQTFFQLAKGRLSSIERFDFPSQNTQKLEEAFTLFTTKIRSNSGDREELNQWEYRAFHTVVTRIRSGVPLSLTDVPVNERLQWVGASRALYSLFDGKRNLLECFYMLEAESGQHFSEDAIKKELETLRFLEKYGYVSLTKNTSTTLHDFKYALNYLGIHSKMKLCVHTKFSSFGNFEGGPEAFCLTLMKIIGKDGVLMMPSFAFSVYFGQQKIFDVKETASSCGIVTDVFRKMPGVLRSWDPCHAFAVYGKEAYTYVANHHLIPTVSEGSPLGLLEKENGWCLTISASDAVTFMHIVESSNNVSCLGVRSEEYPVKLPNGEVVRLRTWGWREKQCPISNYGKIFDIMRKQGEIKEIMLGVAHLMLFRLKAYRKAYEYFLKQECPKCRICPRHVSQTVKSDWNAKTNRLKKSNTYTGQYFSLTNNNFA